MDKLFKESFPTDSVRIKRMLIFEKTSIKIKNKHGISKNEIFSAMSEGNPIFKRVGGNQVMAITKYSRFITIFFTYTKQIAKVKTAYLSSESQIKRYKNEI